MDYLALLTDPVRLGILSRIDLLDTPPETAFDRITRLAHHSLRVPVALFCLISPDHAFIKSSFGLSESSSYGPRVPLTKCFCQWVFASDRALVLPDVAASQFAESEMASALGIRGFIGIPLIVRGHPIGVLNCIDTRPRSWTTQEIALAQDLGATASAELELRLTLRERAETEELEHQRTGVMELIAGVVGTFSTLRTLPAQMEACAQAIARNVEAGYLAFWLLDEARETLTLQSKTGCATPPEWETIALSHDCRLSRIVADRQMYVTDHLQSEPSIVNADWARQHNLVAFAGYPLINGNELIGIGALCAHKPVRPAYARGLVSLANAAALAIVRDRTQRSISASERRYRALVESSAHVILRSDLSGMVTHTSPGWRDLTGQDPGQVLRHGWYRTIHPDDRQRLIGQWLNSFATCTPHRLQCRIRHTDGSFRWIEINAVPVLGEDGKVTEYMSSCTEITERRRANDGLRLLTKVGNVLGSTLDYAATLENVARFALGFADLCSVNLLRERGDIERVAIAATDPTKQAMMERDKGSIRRDHPYHPVSLALSTGEIQLISRADDNWKRRIARNDVHYRYMNDLGIHSLIAAPLLGSGPPLGAIVLSRCAGQSAFAEADGALALELGRRAGIALERAQLYRKLVEHEHELSESNRRKDEFLAMLAHELRNPIAPIRSAVEILEAGVGDTKQEWARDVIKRQTNHMVRLIDDLLDISRVARGKISLKRETVQVGVIVAEAVETARPAVDAKQHQLVVELPETPIWIEADRARMVQAVANLLNNAAKFTPERGTITITGGREDRFAVIRVRDTGAGIPRQQLQSVFDLFTQADRTLAHSGGGLGIGLNLVRRLIEMHGGTVSVASDGLNRGSEFRIAVALAPEPRRTLRAERPASVTLQGRRILVVDDNVDSAETLTAVLQLHGAEVTMAFDGLTALTLVRGFLPQIVLADLGLPDIDGYEVARRLRADLANAPLLVAVSGYGDAQARERSQAAGFAHHLIKPIDVKETIALLSRLIDSPIERSLH